MDIQPIHALLVHGSIVFLSGLLSGFPFWLAIITNKRSEAIRAWRVAHATLIGCGLIMIAAGLMGSYMTLSASMRAFMVWSFIVSGYAFIIALAGGAVTGLRALVPKPVGFNTILFLGHLIGATGAVVGVCLIIYGLIV